MQDHSKSLAKSRKLWGLILNLFKICRIFIPQLSNEWRKMNAFVFLSQGTKKKESIGSWTSKKWRKFNAFIPQLAKQRNFFYVFVPHLLKEQIKLIFSLLIYRRKRKIKWIYSSTVERTKKNKFIHSSSIKRNQEKQMHVLLIYRWCDIARYMAIVGY